MLKQPLNNTTVGALVATLVVLVGALCLYWYRAATYVPPPPARDRPVAGAALPSGPIPADKIRHGPIAP